MAPLTLTELLRRIGDENITIQNLLENIVRIDARGGTRVKGKRARAPLETLITFATGPQFMTPNTVGRAGGMHVAVDDSMTADGKPKYLGMVIWLPTHLIDAAQAGAMDAAAIFTSRLAAVVTGGWRPLSVADAPTGNVLVTNNLNARDRHGVMSHVWIAHPHPSVNPDEGWICFTEADQKVRGLTHYHPLPSADVAKTSVGALII